MAARVLDFQSHPARLRRDSQFRGATTKYRFGTFAPAEQPTSTVAQPTHTDVPNNDGSLSFGLPAHGFAVIAEELANIRLRLTNIEAALSAGAAQAGTARMVQRDSPVVPPPASSMCARLRDIAESDEDHQISEAAFAAASRAISHIDDFLRYTGRLLPSPDIFANRAGEISLEWLPHLTNSAVVASMLISAGGDSTDYYIAEGKRVMLDLDGRVSGYDLLSFLNTLRDVLAGRRARS